MFMTALMVMALPFTEIQLYSIPLAPAPTAIEIVKGGK